MQDPNVLQVSLARSFGDQSIVGAPELERREECLAVRIPAKMIADSTSS